MIVPLIGESYVYIGKNNECHKKGHTYHVIETGQHWDKEYGFVIWVTTEEYPNVVDIDYGCSCSLDYFRKNFWKS